MIRVQAQGGAEAVLGFGDVALGVMRHAEIVVSIGAGGVEPQRLALAGNGLLRAAKAEHGEAQVGPGLLEVGIERDGAPVERFGLVEPVAEMEVEAGFVVGMCGRMVIPPEVVLI